MSKLAAAFWGQFRKWDRPAQIAFGIGVILLILDFGLLAFGGQSLRTPSAIGFVGLVIALQIIVLWANRGMVTAYTQAQRHYLDENFEAARDLLEDLHSRGKADVRSLTLLGNTYRQLGDLSQSETVLLEALHNAPNHHFPLYGFGRTLLVQGRYTEAVDALTQALDAGAPPVILLDVGEALYRMGRPQEAVERLSAVPQTDEPHRALMAAYLLNRLGVAGNPDVETLRTGLPYWQATAERYSDTLYGQALSGDVKAMRAYLEET